MKKQNVAEKIIAKAAHKTAKLAPNSNCFFLFNQPKVPEKVMKLRKV